MEAVCFGGRLMEARVFYVATFMNNVEYYAYLIYSLPPIPYNGMLYRQLRQV